MNKTIKDLFIENNSYSIKIDLTNLLYVNIYVCDRFYNEIVGDFNIENITDYIMCELYDNKGLIMEIFDLDNDLLEKDIIQVVLNNVVYERG